MKIKKRLLSLALSGVMVLGLMPGMSLTALADGDTSTYTLTIPSTLTVANSGWNDAGGISATGTLASGKKLTVTASSDGEFALVNQSDNTQKVGYKPATASTDTEATTSWTFDSLSSTATKKDMGIIVEDYSTKPAGTYQDTVTFTAKVDAAVNTYTSLKVGDVLHIGDILNNSTSYHGKGSALINTRAPFTLVRVNITGNSMTGSTEETVEAADGQYYAFKSNDGTIYSSNIGTEGKNWRVEATSTSCGVVVYKLEGNGYIEFTAHEP